MGADAAQGLFIGGCKTNSGVQEAEEEVISTGDQHLLLNSFKGEAAPQTKIDHALCLKLSTLF